MRYAAPANGRPASAAVPSGSFRPSRRNSARSHTRHTGLPVPAAALLLTPRPWNLPDERRASAASSRESSDHSHNWDTSRSLGSPLWSSIEPPILIVWDGVRRGNAEFGAKMRQLDWFFVPGRLDQRFSGLGDDGFRDP